MKPDSPDDGLAPATTAGLPPAPGSYRNQDASHPHPRRAPWSLRRRLIVGLVAVVALVSVALGTVSTLALRATLMDRLEGQAGELVRGPLFDGGDGPGGGAFDDSAPQRVGSVVVVAVDDEIVRADSVDEFGDRSPLDDESAWHVLEAADAHDGAATVSIDGLGDYVVQSDERGAATVVAGLSTSEVTAATANLAIIFAIVALGAIALVAVLGSVLVGQALRPLDRVAATARDVATRSLDRGDVRLPERVPAADTDPRTEVGQVGASLNLLLDHVEAALSARQRSESQLRQFVADASHELRTPLAAVRGYTELTGREPERLSDDQRHSLQRIDAESRRMTTLVEDLLLLARLDAGAATARREPVDLVHLVVDAVSDAMAVCREHEWRIELPDDDAAEVDPAASAGAGADVVVAGDPDRLHQLVVNLLSNARQHTPPGTTVTASVRREGAAAVVEIADTGPGIDARLLPGIFGRFVRGDTARTRHGGESRSGLGLAIVQAIAQAHGGTVSVASGAVGSTFTVRLPLARR